MRNVDSRPGLRGLRCACQSIPFVQRNCIILEIRVLTCQRFGLNLRRTGTLKLRSGWGAPGETGAGSLSIQPIPQVRHSKAEYFRNPPQIDERDVSLTSLDETDVRLVEFAAPRKLRLCPLQLFAAYPKAVPEFPEEFFVVEVHWLDANVPASKTTLT